LQLPLPVERLAGSDFLEKQEWGGGVLSTAYSDRQCKRRDTDLYSSPFFKQPAGAGWAQCDESIVARNHGL